jgi:hypothetical protein
LNVRITVLGMVFVVIALTLGGIQDLHVYELYGSGSYKWYFYGFIGVILLLGAILAVYGLRKNRHKQVD